MNKKEALIKAIKDGAKIRYSTWKKKEYIRWSDSSGSFIDENDLFHVVAKLDCEGWEFYRETFDKTQAIRYMLEGKHLYNETDLREDCFYIYCETVHCFLRCIRNEASTIPVNLNCLCDSGWFLKLKEGSNDL